MGDKSDHPKDCLVNTFNQTAHSTMNDAIVRLREETGAGVMDCKRALDDAQGDLDKARTLIFERGAAKAEKKAERKTGSGLLETYVHNNRVGVLLELRCETDFVARTDAFKTLAHDIVMQIASMNPQSVDELLTQEFIKDSAITINELVTRAIASIGENIKIERFCRYEL